MTMPMVLPRVTPETAGAAPNAPASAVAPPQVTDGSVVAQFGAVLTMLLGHTASAVGASAHTHATSDAGEGASDAEGENTDTAAMVPSTYDATESHPAVETHMDSADAHATTLVATPHGGRAQLGDAAHDEPDAGSSATANALALVPPGTTVLPDANLVLDATTARRGLDLLAPELRDRLERVIERMESEFGYRVEVTETFRTQARQDALYAQGRTEPGQVVTWTRASNHTLGRAADVVIDGSYTSALPYERLAALAREEGLRTLGPRDPGHIELPSLSAFASARGSADGPSAPDRDVRAAVIARPPASVASPSSIVPAAAELESRGPGSGATPQSAAAIAGVARVAQVSPVARVARVAEVAQVAVVGGQATPAVHAATPGAAADGHTTGNDGGKRDGGTATAEPNDGARRRSRIDPAAARDSAAEVLRQPRDELVHAVAGTDPGASTASSASSGEATSVGHTDMSERIARLLKVQDAAGDRPLSQVLLRLERPDGGEDRLRVDLRGNAVSATLDVGDQGAADRLGANVKELQRALERHGFETDSLTVRTATRAVESSTLSRAAGASVESDLQRAAAPATTSNTSTNTSSRERGARHDEQRPSPDSQRQRSRREQKGDR
jgi:hypothetical protein